MSKKNHDTLEVTLEEMYAQQSAMLLTPSPHPETWLVVDEDSSTRADEPAWIGVGQPQRSYPRRSPVLGLAAAAALTLVSVGAMAYFESEATPNAANTGSVDATTRQAHSAVALTAMSIHLLEPSQSGEQPIFHDPFDASYFQSAYPASFVRIHWEQEDGWHQLQINFRRDETEWWASELWSSNEGAWDVVEGEFFRTDLGQVFEGDLMLPFLQIKGLTLEAFRPGTKADTTVTLQNRSRAPFGLDPHVVKELVFTQDRIVMWADEVTVLTNNGPFRPPHHLANFPADWSFMPDTSLPNTDSAPTSLDLDWTEDDITMGLQMTFQSDGQDWWASDIWTRDGSAEATWIKSSGEYFRSPLGTDFEGDLLLNHVEFRGIRLGAYVRPPACDNPTTEFALVGHPWFWQGTREPSTIRSPESEADINLTLFNTGSCQPVDIKPGTIDIEPLNTDVVTVLGWELTADPTGHMAVRLHVGDDGHSAIRVRFFDSDERSVDRRLLAATDVAVTAFAGLPSDP